MRHFFSFAVVLLLCAIWYYDGYIYGHKHYDHHRCDSPCVVYLPDNTQEDGWYFDYGWKDRHTPVVGIKTCPIGDMSGRCG